MKAHRTDGVSLVFALIFLAIAAWWLVAQILHLALPAVGWFLAGSLILLGVLGLLGALRSGRSGPPRTDPAAFPGSTADPAAFPGSTADPAAFPGSTADPAADTGLARSDDDRFAPRSDHGRLDDTRFDEPAAGADRADPADAELTPDDPATAELTPDDPADARTAELPGPVAGPAPGPAGELNDPGQADERRG